MREAVADLWTTPADWRVITTNGTRKKDGSAVMGRGCAAQAKARYPGLDRVLGAALQKDGNCVNALGCYDGAELWAFPVKHEWWERADLALIERSTMELYSQWQRRMPRPQVVLVRPGCDNGRRSWAEVRPILSAVWGKFDELLVVTQAETPHDL